MSAAPDVRAAMTPALTSRLPGVGTTIFTVMSQLAQQHRAINLAQGFPSFEPPQRLRERVAHHALTGPNQYAPMAGAPALREAIARKVARCYGRTVSPETEITVTCGGTEALSCAIQAVVHPGDEVIVFDPAYDSYEPIAQLAGGHVRHVPLARPGFGIDWARFDAALGPRTRLVIVNTPHNPTGACLSPADLEALAERLRPTGAFLLSDEVYEHMVYDGVPHASVLGHAELAARSFVVSSFGKTYHATGWKIGYCVAPPPLTAELRKLHQYVTFSIATPLQLALADYMDEDPDWEARLPVFYQERRDRLGQLLAGSRLRWTPARSTYFQLVDYSAISDLPDTAFAAELIRTAGVVTIPVSPFCAAPPPDELATTSPSTSITTTPPPELLAVTAPAIDSTSTPPPALRASTAVRRGTVATIVARPLQFQFQRKEPDPLRSTTTSSLPGRLSSSRTSNFSAKSSRSDSIVTVAVSPSTPRTATEPASERTESSPPEPSANCFCRWKSAAAAGAAASRTASPTAVRRSVRMEASLSAPNAEAAERFQDSGASGPVRSRARSARAAAEPSHALQMRVRSAEVSFQESGPAPPKSRSTISTRTSRARHFSTNIPSSDSLRSLWEAVRPAIRVSSGLAIELDQAGAAGVLRGSPRPSSNARTRTRTTGGASHGAVSRQRRASARSSTASAATTPELST